MTLNVGTLVIAPIVPNDSADTYPTHEAQYGLGGLRTVSDTAAMNAITAARREAGMKVWSVADQHYYTMSTDLTVFTSDLTDSDILLAITEGSNNIRLYSTNAAAQADIAHIPVNSYIEIFSDEVLGNRRDLYQNISGTLTFVLFLDSIFSVSNIAGLRALTSASFTSNSVNVLGYTTIGDGGGDQFIYDSADHSSSDNSATIIIDVSGRRWKRKGDLTFKKCGAVGDGVAIDTVACQRALDVISASKGLLRITTGTYKSGNLILTNAVDVTILGEGGTINWTGTASGSNYIGFQLSGTCTNVEINKLRLNGDGVLGNRHAGMWNLSGQILTNCRYVNNHITNIIVGMSMAADSSGSVTAGLMQNNYIDTVIGLNTGTGYGIHTSEPTSGTLSYTKILGNTIVNAGRHSIYCARGTGFVIANNTVKNHHMQSPTGGFRCAIVVSRCFDVSVVGNVVDTFWDGALEISAGHDTGDSDGRKITIIGNTLSNPQNTVPNVFIGSQDPSTELTPQDIIFVDNTVTQVGLNIDVMRVYSAINLQISNNLFACDTVPSGATMLSIESTLDGGGTATYSNNITVSNNTFVGTGTAVNGIRLDTSFCTSLTALNVFSNTFKLTGNTFTTSTSITNPNLTVFGQPIDGVSFSGVITFKSFNLGGVTNTTSIHNTTAAINTTTFMEFTGVGSDPAAGNASTGRLYTRGNGSGKTQLVIRFPTGAIQVIATEP